jgi:RsiW-degrading membrane proteinase PrsW (M82 family)
MGIILLTLSVLPVILLMVYIYRQDKYEKEPLGLLIRAFIGGMIAIPLDLALVSLINSIVYSDTVFYSAFIEAGFCEELCKYVILFLTIWWNKNFNEYLDGIVYATFVGLGFACVENILYVFQGGIGTGIVRALLSVPGHFLFAVIMGYFFSMAKFSPKGRFGYLMLGLFGAVLAHGLFDWLLMITDKVSELWMIPIFILFIWGDIKLWKIGLKYIRKHQENSQFKEPDYKQIDWNAGDKF